MFWRYINGARMIDDLVSCRVSIYETICMLSFVFLPYDSFLNYLFPKLGAHNEPLPYEWIGCLLMFVSMVFVLLMLGMKNKQRFVEIYVCLYFVANLTAYLFLIPFVFFSEFALSFFEKVNAHYDDYFMLIYFPLYMTLSAYIWRRNNVR